MRKFLVGIFITAIAVMSQDRGAEVAVSGSQVPDFASLEKSIRGFAMGTREVAVYRVRTATLPTHRHSKPFVIVWTEKGDVIEQRDGGLPTAREFDVGQIDFYPAGTTHSLHARKGSLRFTVVELRQPKRSDAEALPNKPGGCEKSVEFPEGGFACLLHIPPGQEITIPELGVNAFRIAVDSGRVRETIPRTQWESHYREGSSQYMPGYEEHRLRNLERRPMRLVLIVPPPAKYEVRAR
jgi:quercetin dioxygenase-like cupin family protein